MTQQEKDKCYADIKAGGISLLNMFGGILKTATEVAKPIVDQTLDTLGTIGKYAENYKGGAK